MRKNKRENLHLIAKSIYSTISDADLTQDLNIIDDDDLEAVEGKVLYKLHKYKERNKTLVKKKKEKHLKMNSLFDGKTVKNVGSWLMPLLSLIKKETLSEALLFFRTSPRESVLRRH